MYGKNNQNYRALNSGQAQYGCNTTMLQCFDLTAAIKST